MDKVRIGFFLGELYGLSCCACDIGNAFLYGKTKEKVLSLLVQSLVQHYVGGT